MRDRLEPPILYEPPSRLARHDRAIVWLLFVLSLLIRAAYLKQLRDSPLWDDLPVDLSYYREWGLRIAGGDWLGTEVFEQSPLYAYVLGALFKLFGPDLLAPRLLQIVLGSVTCVLVYRIGKLAFGPAIGLVAGVMAALYGPFLFYDGMIMKTVFAVLFATWMTWHLLASNGSQRGMLFSAGLALGLGALVRDNLILLVPAVALWLALDPWLGGPRMASGRVREGIGRIAAFGLGVLLAVAPVTLRNWYVSGQVVPLTSGGGEVFYIGNNPGADGRYSPPPFVRASSVVEHEDFRREAARRLGRPEGSLTRKEASDYWLRQGLSWIAQNPGDFTALLGQKMLIFWNHYELPDNHNYAHHRTLLQILRLPLITFGLLAPMAVAGLVLSARRWRDLLPLYLIGLAYVGTVMLFFNFGRFRMPLVPLLLAFAGCGVVETVRAAAGRRFGRVAVALAAALIAFAVTSRNLETDEVHLGQAASQQAELLRRAGRTEEAERASADGLQRLEKFFEAAGGRVGDGGRGVPAPGAPGRPNLGASFYAVLAEAYETRAAIIEGLGRPEEAAGWRRLASRADPSLHSRGSDPERLAARGDEAIQAGRASDAVRLFEQALEADPQRLSPVTRLRLSLRLAESLHRAGRPHEALRTVERALEGMAEISPRDQANAHFGRALIYRDLGEPERMRFHLRECLRLDPEHPRAAWIGERLQAP